VLLALRRRLRTARSRLRDQVAVLARRTVPPADTFGALAAAIVPGLIEAWIHRARRRFRPARADPDRDRGRGPAGTGPADTKSRPAPDPFVKGGRPDGEQRERPPVDEEVIGEISDGLLVLVGVTHTEHARRRPNSWPARRFH